MNRCIHVPHMNGRAAHNGIHFDALLNTSAEQHTRTQAARGFHSFHADQRAHMSKTRQCIIVPRTPSNTQTQILIWKRSRATNACKSSNVEGAIESTRLAWIEPRPNPYQKRPSRTDPSEKGLSRTDPSQMGVSRTDPSQMGVSGTHPSQKGLSGTHPPCIRRVCPGQTLLRWVCPGQTLLIWVCP